MKRCVFSLLVGALILGGLALMAGAAEGPPARSHTVFADLASPTW